MTHLDVIGGEKGKVGLETVKMWVLEENATRMLRSIQDLNGFGSAEDAILKWLEGCSIDGVERLAIALDDYLQNRREAEGNGEET